MSKTRCGYVTGPSSPRRRVAVKTSRNRLLRTLAAAVARPAGVADALAARGLAVRAGHRPDLAGVALPAGVADAPAVGGLAVVAAIQRLFDRLAFGAGPACLAHAAAGIGLAVPATDDRTPLPRLAGRVRLVHARGHDQGERRRDGSQAA